MFKPKIILIFGVFRSGTSALAGLLHKGGIPAGENLLGPDWINPEGYYEDKNFIQINKNILKKLGIERFNIPYSYNFDENREKVRPEINQMLNLVDTYAKKYDVWCWKQPESSFAFHFWGLELFKKYDWTNFLFLRTRRDALDTANSIQRALGLSQEQAHLQIYKYNLYMDKIWNNYCGIIYEVDFDQLQEDPATFILELNSFLGGTNFPQIKFNDHIKPELVHFKENSLDMERNKTTD